jgi:hypothetical protein
MFFDIPDVATMETALAPKATKPKAPKAPCKWGPRDENGFCPPKPAAGGNGSNGARSGGSPCKYGPRDADGNCPKKPASARPPCKWGPRGGDGLCPKKPKKSLPQNIAEKIARDTGRTLNRATVDIAWEMATNREFRTEINRSVAAGLKKAAGGVLAFVTSPAALATAAAVAVGIARVKATEAVNLKRNLERDPYWPQKQKLVNDAIVVWENVMGRIATPVEKSRIMKGIWPDHPAFVHRPDIKPMGEN